MKSPNLLTHRVILMSFVVSILGPAKNSLLLHLSSPPSVVKFFDAQRSPRTLGALAFPNRSKAVTAIVSARGMVVPFEPLGDIITVRQVPPLQAWTAIFEVLPSGSQWI